MFCTQIGTVYLVPSSCRSGQLQVVAPSPSDTCIAFLCAAMAAGTARDMYGFFSFFVCAAMEEEEEGVVTDACVRGKKGRREGGKEGDVCGYLSLSLSLVFLQLVFLQLVFLQLVFLQLVFLQEGRKEKTKIVCGSRDSNERSEV